jgi:hypothetical protein
VNGSEAVETPPAAHETAAVLRMHRQGMSAPRICQVLKISKQQLVLELRIAMDDEQEAHRLGHPIHDDGLPADQSAREQYLRMYG